MVTRIPLVRTLLSLIRTKRVRFRMLLHTAMTIDPEQADRDVSHTQSRDNDPWITPDGHPKERLSGWE